MSLRRANNSIQSGVTEMPLFFKVRYGDNQEKLFNTNCSNICLTHAIRKVCRLSVGDKLDLISLSGQPAYIFQRPDDERAHCLVQSREAYIAAKVEVVPHSTLRHKFTPLLKDMEPYPEVLERLAQEEDPDNYSKSSRRTPRRRTGTTRPPSLSEASGESAAQRSPSSSRPNSRGWEVSRKLLRNKKLRAMSGGSISERRVT